MTNYNILLVEDDPAISEMLKNYLATEHCEVTCAFDGEDACRQFDAASFHLVLLDLMIPKISGMEVRIYDANVNLQELSRTLILHDVPVTALGKKTETLEDYFLKLTGEVNCHAETDQA